MTLTTFRPGQGHKKEPRSYVRKSQALGFPDLFSPVPDRACAYWLDSYGSTW
jgi:hypothetical protein